MDLTDNCIIFPSTGVKLRKLDDFWCFDICAKVQEWKIGPSVDEEARFLRSKAENFLNRNLIGNYANEGKSVDSRIVRVKTRLEKKHYHIARNCASHLVCRGNTHFSRLATCMPHLAPEASATRACFSCLVSRQKQRLGLGSMKALRRNKSSGWPGLAWLALIERTLDSPLTY